MTALSAIDNDAKITLGDKPEGATILNNPQYPVLITKDDGQRQFRIQGEKNGNVNDVNDIGIVIDHITISIRGGDYLVLEGSVGVSPCKYAMLLTDSLIKDIMKALNDKMFTIKLLSVLEKEY